MPTNPKSEAAKKRTTPGLSLPPQEQAPTSVEAWGSAPVQEDGFLVELPSGNRARVRRTLDLPFLLQSGQIPNPLGQIVRKMMDSGNAMFPREEMSGKANEQLLKLIDQTVCKVMLEPKVSAPEFQRDGESWEEYTRRIVDWQPEPGTLSIFVIETMDKMFLFAVAQGMATDLAPFRAEANAVVGALQAGQDVPLKTKPTARTGAARSKPKSKARKRA